MNVSIYIIIVILTLENNPNMLSIIKNIINNGFGIECFSLISFQSFWYS